MKRYINIMLIFIVMIGFAAAVPLLMERINWEKTSKQVELVMDYDDIFILTNNADNPRELETKFLGDIKGYVNSIAVYETTLERLKVQGEYSNKIWVYSGRELLDPFRSQQTNKDITSNHTYILFTNEEIKHVWEPIITKFLAKEGEITQFNWNGLNGVEIGVPYQKIKLLSLGIDPILANDLNGLGFNIVPRLSNSYPDKERTIALVEQAAQFKPSHIIFQGEEVTGFPSHLSEVANIMSENNIGLGAIELVKEQQGIKSLAYYLAAFNYDGTQAENWYVSRVHSLTEFTMGKMVNPSPAQLKGKEPVDFMDLQEQVELAVTERNIRVIYLHAAMNNPHVPISYFDYFALRDQPDKILDKTVLGIYDLADRIQAEGYTLGQAQPFTYEEKTWMVVARWLVLLAGIAVMSLLVNQYLPSTQLPTFLLGLLGIIIATVLSMESLYFKFVSLGTAVAVPILAITYSLRETSKVLAKKVSYINIIKIYLITSLLSILGAILVAAMLNHLKFSLYLDQFRGVSVLYLAPIILTLVLVMLKLNDPIMKWLKGDFKNYYILIISLLGVFILYYIARSGNEAAISTIEIKFRRLLQTYLDIRPRTKEFLFGYPVFLLSIYLAYYYKRAAYLLVPAVMGQLSIISTFTHLHTPFVISLMRTFIGLGLGLISGLILILGWIIAKALFIKIMRRIYS